MRRIFYSLLIFLPLAAHADARFSGFGDIFMAVPNDVSVSILGQVFGRVPGVLSGSGSQLLGVMFLLYNIAVLGLGSMILSYMVLRSILLTAVEGEILGQKW